MYFILKYDIMTLYSKNKNYIVYVVVTSRLLFVCSNCSMYTVIPKFVVKSLRFQELVVSAVLHDLSIINDVDLVHVLDGGETVSDGD